VDVYFYIEMHVRIQIHALRKEKDFVYYFFKKANKVFSRNSSKRNYHFLVLIKNYT